MALRLVDLALAMVIAALGSRLSFRGALEEGILYGGVAVGLIGLALVAT